MQVTSVLLVFTITTYEPIGLTNEPTPPHQPFREVWDHLGCSHIDIISAWDCPELPMQRFRVIVYHVKVTQNYIGIIFQSHYVKQNAFLMIAAAFEPFRKVIYWVWEGLTTALFYNATYVSQAFDMMMFMNCCFSCWLWSSVLKQARQRDTVFLKNIKSMSVNNFYILAKVETEVYEFCKKVLTNNSNVYC